MPAGNRLNRFFQIWVDVGVVQNGFGVNTNVVVDDEFQTRKAYTLIGQLSKVKCQLGIADIHHDFGGDVGHGAAYDFGHFGFKQAVINASCIALCTTDRDERALFQ